MVLTPLTKGTYVFVVNLHFYFYFLLFCIFTRHLSVQLLQCVGYHVHVTDSVLVALWSQISVPMYTRLCWCVHPGLLMTTQVSSFSVFPALLTSGSVLPYHPDAPLWQGLQNVQQDFPITRVRHHRPARRQWVVANNFFPAMCSWWSLAA